MRKVLIVLISLLFCFCAYFVATNVSSNVSFIFANKEYALNLAIYTCVALFMGVLAGTLFAVQKYLSQNDTVKAYKRQLEKSAVANSSSSSKVEVLEAKIQTLEKALENALKNKN